MSQSLATPNVQKNILIVEDHVDSAAILFRLLSRLGYNVLVATTVSTALQEMTHVAQRRIDLVVSDIGLPDGTGYELMQQIRDGYDVPGIALSGYGQSRDVARAMESGFSYHITKPIDFDKLRSAIKEIFAR